MLGAVKELRIEANSTTAYRVRALHDCLTAKSRDNRSTHWGLECVK